jgi:putative ABC transport system permease protein
VRERIGSPQRIAQTARDAVRWTRRAADWARDAITMPLVWRNFRHHKTRSIVAVAGVSVPIVMIFVQLGLNAAMMRTATLFYDDLRFDLVLVSHSYLFFSRPGELPRERIYQALGHPQVRAAAPLHIGYNLWRNVENGERREILVLGIEPRAVPLAALASRADVAALSRPDTVLIDRATRPEYGPHAPGTVSELGPRRVEVIGEYDLGYGFSAFGVAVVSAETFAALSGAAADRVSVGLIELAEGASPRAVAEQLRELLPPDTRVLTRAEVEGNEETYWRRATSLGVINAFGLLVAFGVGTMILYQVLVADITQRLAEFATLKAMGYDNGYIERLVVGQAWAIALAGFAPALVAALLVYARIVAATALPMTMTPGRAVLVAGFALAMCSLSALASLRRVKGTDPAELFA